MGFVVAEGSPGGWGRGLGQCSGMTPELRRCRQIADDSRAVRRVDGNHLRLSLRSKRRCGRHRRGSAKHIVDSHVTCDSVGGYGGDESWDALAAAVGDLSVAVCITGKLADGWARPCGASGAGRCRKRPLKLAQRRGRRRGGASRSPQSKHRRRETNDEQRRRHEKASPPCLPLRFRDQRIERERKAEDVQGHSTSIVSTSVTVKREAGRLGQCSGMTPEPARPKARYFQSCGGWPVT